jgi:hypothetical protein
MYIDSNNLKEFGKGRIKEQKILRSNGEND